MNVVYFFECRGAIFSQRAWTCGRYLAVEIDDLHIYLYTASELYYLEIVSSCHGKSLPASSTTPQSPHIWLTQREEPKATISGRFFANTKHLRHFNTHPNRDNRAFAQPQPISDTTHTTTALCDHSLSNHTNGVETHQQYASRKPATNTMSKPSANSLPEELTVGRPLGL